MRWGQLPSSCQGSPRSLTPIPALKLRRRSKETKPDLYVRCCRSSTQSHSVSPRRSLCISIRIPGPEVPPESVVPEKVTGKRAKAAIRYRSEPRSRKVTAYVNIRSKRELPRKDVSLVLDVLKTPEEEDSEITYKLLESMKEHYRVLRKYPKTTSQCYKTLQVISEPGSTVRVTLSLHRLTGLPVLIKCIPRLSSKIQRVRTLREIANQVRCRHPLIVRLLEVFESAQCLNLVFEHCKGGDLLSYIQSVGRLEENKVRRLCRCIGEGLQACHRQGVAHRDIQLSTVLLTEAQDEAKISSFSCSRLLTPGEKLTEQSQQMAYSAPEILVAQGYDGFAADLWCFGVVLYTLIAGQLPFQACNTTDLAKFILKGSFNMPIQASQEAQSLISRLLQPIPKHRITLDNVLSHPWFSPEPLYTTESTDLQALEAIREAGLSASHLLACLEAGEINHLTTAYELMRLHKTYSLRQS